MSYCDDIIDDQEIDLMLSQHNLQKSPKLKNKNISPDLTVKIDYSDDYYPQFQPDIQKFEPDIPISSQFDDFDRLQVVNPKDVQNPLIQGGGKHDIEEEINFDEYAQQIFEVEDVSEYCDSIGLQSQTLEVVIELDDNEHFSNQGQTSELLKMKKEESFNKECEICHKEFDIEEDYLEHVRIKHPLVKDKETGKFKCPFCSYQTKNRALGRMHVRTHTKEKPFQCSVCHKKFSQKAGLQQHLRSHSDEKPYKCKICGQGFKARNTMESHVAMVHEKLKPYQCKVCGQSFGHQSNLRIHKRTHSDDRPFKCPHPDCDRAFKQMAHLQAHLRLHTGERPFKCDVCDATFAHVGNLRQHVITQHTKAYPHNCDVCGKGFISPSDLKRHKDLHEDNYFIHQTV